MGGAIVGNESGCSVRVVVVEEKFAADGLGGLTGERVLAGESGNIPNVMVPLCVFFFLPGIRSIVVVLIVVVVVDVTVVVVVGVGVGGGACIETNTRRRALRYVRTPGHIK